MELFSIFSGFMLQLFREFDKSSIQKCKMGVDAFIQMGFQLAYYRVSISTIWSCSSIGPHLSLLSFILFVTRWMGF